MATPQSALQASFADHRHPADETCPYCDQAIPNDRAEEIRARYAFKQKQDEEAANARADKRIADARAEVETRCPRRQECGAGRSEEAGARSRAASDRRPYGRARSRRSQGCGG